MRRLDLVAAGAATMLGVLGALGTAGTAAPLSRSSDSVNTCLLKPAAKTESASIGGVCRVTTDAATVQSQAQGGRPRGPTGDHQVTMSPDLARAADVARPAAGPGTAGTGVVSLLADSLALVALTFLLLTFVRRRPSQVRVRE